MMAGVLIGGRYELGPRLGVGGMSTVQEAFDRRLERHVAVKLLAEHLADDPQFVSRFRREAQSAASLSHPNIVQVFDFGLDSGSGRHYIVMEIVRGRSGAEILRERGRLGVEEAIDLVGQSCRGLEYAHASGVVHRDVKPGNLLRSDEGVVKLADFGIAKALSDESSITQVGSVLGTASYLSPEQARGEEAGPPADLYALGVVAYQLLSGRLPYEAQSLTALALKQQREAPAFLHELDPRIPEALSLAVDRALALDPEERQANAGELRVDLEQGARGIGARGDTAATRAVAPPTDATRAVVPTDVTRAVAPDTDATRAVPAGSFASRTGEQPAVAARVPRPARSGGRPAPPPARPAAAVGAAERPRRGGAVKRFFVWLLILALLGAGGAAAIIATSDDRQAVKTRRVTADKVQDTVDQLVKLVEDNTR